MVVYKLSINFIGMSSSPLILGYQSTHANFTALSVIEADFWSSY